jgi:hypothetical protein
MAPIVDAEFAYYFRATDVASNDGSFSPRSGGAAGPSTLTIVINHAHA